MENISSENTMPIKNGAIIVNASNADLEPLPPQNPLPEEDAAAAAAAAAAEAEAEATTAAAAEAVEAIRKAAKVAQDVLALAAANAVEVVKLAHKKNIEELLDIFEKATSAAASAWENKGLSDFLQVFAKTSDAYIVATTAAANTAAKGIIAKSILNEQSIKFSSLLAAAKAAVESHNRQANRAILAQKVAMAAKIASAARALAIETSARKSQQEFMAHVSHEIRTPLTSIIGHAKIMAQIGPKTPFSAEHGEWVQSILRGAEHLQQIINDILDLSKIEAGKIEIESRPADIRQLMNDVKSMLYDTAAKKGLDLSIVVDKSLPYALTTDSLHLKQILINIIGNAIKFTNQGGIDIHVGFQKGSGDASESMLAIAVSDTGMGMTPQQISKIFAPFVQGDMSITRTFGGTGLGLAISKKLANMLGGDLVVCHSEIGKGSTFTLTVPTGCVAASDPTALAIELAQRPENVQYTKPPVDSLKGMKILIVEDSDDIVALVLHLLRSQGALVDSAENGEKAIQSCHNNQYDLVLMDIQMPVLDGIQAMKKLRQEGYLAPIVAMTAQALNGKRQQHLDQGFTDYISKPIDFQHLQSLAQQYKRPAQTQAQ